MTDAAGPPLCEKLADRLVAEMARWMKPGLPLRMEVGGAGGIQRRSPDRSGWDDIMTLGFLLRRTFEEVEGPRETEEHAAVTLPFSLCQALGTAARLSEQILEDGGECRKTFPFGGPESCTGRPRGLDEDLSAAKEIRENLTRRIQSRHPRPSAPGGARREGEMDRARPLRRAASPWAGGTGRDRVLHTEDLIGFLHRRMREPLDVARPRIEGGAVALRRRREEGEAALRKASPVPSSRRSGRAGRARAPLPPPSSREAPQGPSRCVALPPSEIAGLRGLHPESQEAASTLRAGERGGRALLLPELSPASATLEFRPGTW